jgi:hypothetical protein
MYRYGREMYLRGKFPEAAKVFLQILKNDCGNKIAQYHLRQIANKSPELAFLNAKLDKLPCKSYDFTKEDFLPASVYYEKDPDIILEQMISQNMRRRLSEKEMAEKIDQYMIMVRELESTVSMLKQAAASPVVTSSPGMIDPKTLERVEEGRRSASKIEKEINVLKNQLASERLDRQKEVQDMRTRLAQAEASIPDQIQIKTAQSKVNLPEVPSSSAPIYSADAQALLNAVTQARIELEGKERGLVEKDKALVTLQSRFNDIQRRLKAIQIDLANKNAEIQAINTNLQNTQKP